jgi:hypothetical protein
MSDPGALTSDRVPARKRSTSIRSVSSVSVSSSVSSAGSRGHKHRSGGGRREDDDDDDASSASSSAYSRRSSSLDEDAVEEINRASRESKRANKETKKLSSRIKGLRHLVAKIALFPEAFDDEDSQALKFSIERLEKDLERQRSAATHLEVVLANMTRVLQKRQIVLEEADAVLRDNPLVLEFFAVKQARLEEKRAQLSGIIKNAK